MELIHRESISDGEQAELMEKPIRPIFKLRRRLFLKAVATATTFLEMLEKR